MQQRYKRLPPCEHFDELVVESGQAAMSKISEEDQANINRQMELLQEQFKQFGPKAALELLTAIGIHLAEKAGPQQVRSATVQRRA